MKKVYILKNFKNKDIFVSPMTPKYFDTRTEANYAKIYMEIPEYVVVEVTEHNLTTSTMNQVVEVDMKKENENVIS